MEKLIQKISAIIFDVYDALGSGHSEIVYENAIKVGLRLAKIPYEEQITVPVTYKGFFVGYGCPDIVIRYKTESIVIELKAVAKLGGKEEAQLRIYLNALGINDGLLVNMQAPGYDVEKETMAEIKRLSIKV